MELKIKIKEFVEKRRGLTKEESFAIYVEKNETDHRKQEYNDARCYLNSIGYVFGSNDKQTWGQYGCGTGKFCICEKIRDATPLEVAAWHHLQQCKYCDGCKADGGNRLKVCIFKGTAPCPSISHTQQRAAEVLSGKEIILELI